MRRNLKIAALSVLLALVLIAWSPWMADEQAISVVTQALGGPDSPFVYLGEVMAVKDVPKSVTWAPFGRLVYFPSEAVWYVTFFGSVI